MLACVAGAVQTCTPGTPTGEVCNGLDDDCDGSVDEGGVCTPPPPVCTPAPEACNGRDDNCNGLIDEGCDDDGDNWCDASMFTIGAPPACPFGGGDCDDGWFNDHPGAVEICDGFDNNCNAAVDEGGVCGPPPISCAGLVCDDGNPCTVDSCTTGVGCQHIAGNADVACRTATGSCDMAEACTGTTTLCPADAKRAAGFTCRPAVGPCDMADACDGFSSLCPAADAMQLSTQVCRPSVGPCDPAENCTGFAADCPADALASAGAVCRASSGAGDPAESCTGASASCPPNAPPVCVPATCDDANPCTTDACTATGCTHTIVPGCVACTDATAATACNDGNLCTTDSCVGNVCQHALRTCTGTAVCDAATGICQPGFGVCLPFSVEISPASASSFGVIEADFWRPHSLIPRAVVVSASGGTLVALPGECSASIRFNGWDAPTLPTSLPPAICHLDGGLNMPACVLPAGRNAYGCNHVRSCGCSGTGRDGICPTGCTVATDADCT